MVEIRVNGDLDPVGIVFFRNDQFRKAVLLPMPVEIGEACTGTFADSDQGKDVEPLRVGFEILEAARAVRFP